MLNNNKPEFNYIYAQVILDEMYRYGFFVVNPILSDAGCARFAECLQNFTQRLWSFCSLDFHTFTLQLPIPSLGYARFDEFSGARKY